MRKVGIIFSFAVLISCSTGVKLKPINLGPLFHDSNSKVWLIDKVITKGQNFAPKNDLDKDVIVFYSSGRCMFQPMKTLGDQIGKKGEFTVYSEEKTLSLYFYHEKWDFKLTTVQTDTVVLTPTKDSDLKYKMILVPFPEL